MDQDSKDVSRLDNIICNDCGDVETVEMGLVGDCVVIVCYDDHGNISRVHTHEVYLP